MSNQQASAEKSKYLDALIKLIVYIAVFIIISAILQFLFNSFLPKYGILLARYYIYVNVALTLLLGYLIVRAFADVIQEFLKLKYPIDVARAFRNVFLVIGVGALITTVAGEVGGGLAGVSVGGFLGIVIGFAMQQPLGQAISGLFILIARPFKINDYATILGDTGLVIEVGILFTELKKDDGSKVVIPSNLIIANKVYVLPKPTPASPPKQ